MLMEDTLEYFCDTLTLNKKIEDVRYYRNDKGGITGLFLVRQARCLPGDIEISVYFDNDVARIYVYYSDYIEALVAEKKSLNDLFALIAFINTILFEVPFNPTLQIEEHDICLVDSIQYDELKEWTGEAVEYIRETLPSILIKLSSPFLSLIKSEITLPQAKEQAKRALEN